jgi:hypothetical protein
MGFIIRENKLIEEKCNCAYFPVFGLALRFRSDFAHGIRRKLVSEELLGLN